MSGGTAERMLDHPMAVRVAGDHHAGFYRPRPGTGAAGGATAGVAVEAYRWGTLTAGAAVRTASMLLLLPFMLANLSVWLRPRPAGRVDVLSALCRVLAGTVTAAFVLSVVGVTLDLVGWQCVPYERCRADRAYLSWLSILPMGPRLALLALVPLLMLQVVWRVGAGSARAFEGFGPPPHTGSPGIAQDLASPGFWDDERTPAWLRQIHVAVGAGTVAASLVWGTPHAGGTGWPFLIPPVGLLLCCVVLLCVPVPVAGTLARRVSAPLRVATAGTTAVSLGYAATAGGVSGVSGQLPGYANAIAGLIAAQGVLLLLIAGVTAVDSSMTRRVGRPILRGLGTPVVAATSVTVASAFAATLVFRVADQLDRGTVPGPTRTDAPGVPPLEPAITYWWSALAGLAALMILAAAVGTALIHSRQRRRRIAERVVAVDYPDVPPQAAPRLAAVRQAIARSHVTEELGPVLIAFFLIAALGLATITLDVLGLGPSRFTAELGAQRAEGDLVTAYVTDGGIWIISLLVIGFLLLAYRSYRSADTRRAVAALFDLGDFWPRTVHPFAPPCYAARAVPELTRRVSGLAGRNRVVISGHSHGSVLAVAMILQLPPQVRDRVALLTHGSPLGRIYAHLYPAYLGESTMCEVGDRLGWRWRNLWRETDPVGGPIFDPRGAGPPCRAAAGRVDIRLPDPVGVLIDPADTVPPPLERHQPYQTQPAYQRVVRELIDRVSRDDVSRE
uniref:hypothetical protein n=1 Tax=Micromonospora acroterricola TaxID=2202421 RepID=UPI001F224122|nr:hypothetical protein [Micromonospora acroterricola]